MRETLKNDETLREYLLGRVSDEATLEDLEELLFTDEEFCTRVALAEDELVNDYVLGYLDAADAASFRATLARNPDRRLKLRLTRALREKALARRAEGAKAGAESAQDGAESAEERPADRPSFFAALLDSLRALFRQPKYAAALAALVVAALVSIAYFGGRGRADELAELREIYRGGRPTESRISEFTYAPHTETRGAAEAAERNRLRRVENSLIEAVEKTPDARSRHALGVFRLTQGKHDEAVEEFRNALKFAPRDARIHNDLGAAYFELAKNSPPERRLEALAQSLEEFTTAVELDGRLLEALFNKSLALQELGLEREAKESWTLYLQRDSASPWAEEARRHLSRLEGAQTRFKTDERVLEDFLAALRAGDEVRARKIHDETKGLLGDAAVAPQLSRRLLLARRRGDDAEAGESLRALRFLGDYERERHADFFFLNSPTSTRASARTRSSRCSARERVSTGRALS